MITPTKPALDANAGIYTVRWEQFGILLQADRLYSDRRGHLSAEVVIRATAPGIPPHLLQDRLTLNTASSRDRTAKTLSEMVGDTLPWRQMLEQACLAIMARHREGEPLINLGTRPMPEGLRYRLAPILLERQPTLIFGEGGAAKSFFALYLASLVQMGLAHNGLEPEPGNVLYLDYETDEDTMTTRLEMIANGLKGARPPILYRFCSQPFISEVVEFQRIVQAESIALVVVDSIGAAVPGDIQHEELPNQFYSALRSLRCSALLVSHTQKGGELKTPYGNVYWTNRARSVYELKRSSEHSARSLYLGLYHRKANNTILQDPVGFQLLFGEGDTELVVERQDIRAIADLAEGLPLRDRILDALSHGLLTTPELASAIGETERKIKTTLAHMSIRDITRTGDGWSLRTERQPGE